MFRIDKLLPDRWVARYESLRRNPGMKAESAALPNCRPLINANTDSPFVANRVHGRVIIDLILKMQSCKTQPEFEQSVAHPESVATDVHKGTSHSLASP